MLIVISLFLFIIVSIGIDWLVEFNRWYRFCLDDRLLCVLMSIVFVFFVFSNEDVLVGVVCMVWGSSDSVGRIGFGYSFEVSSNNFNKFF